MDDNTQTTEKKQKIDIPEMEKFFLQGSPDPVDFINILLGQAVVNSASDILLEPGVTKLRVRMRIDGVLYELGQLDIRCYDRIIARLKVVGGLDIAEKRKVQEGQFTYDSGGKIINFRLEITTTVHGELVVIRVHEKATIVMNTASLGMGNEAYQNFQNILNQRSGLVLVCGPTGCGKTTTLYSTIAKINENGKYNVMTIEDPVEFELDNVNQMQTQNDIDFTFAVGLKTILRLSPDIVLVGEIRDKETAEIAVQTGLSGFMVLSTLHAEDSVGAFFRLLDLGIEPYLLNSSLVGIIAQRLVRIICEDCKEKYKPTEDEVRIFTKVMGREPKQFFRGAGCKKCKNSGYRGRIGIFEVLPLSSEIRDFVRDKVSEHELRTKIFRVPSMTLMGDGMEKVENGQTTIEEVLRSGLRMVQ